jgi:arylsulfatase A-like enzyme
MRLEGWRRGFRDRLASESLPALLRSVGFRTATISPFAERHGAWWFYAGFSEMYNTGMGGMESAEHVTPTVLDWIERNAQEDNWFLHVNYWDPHTPYRAPPEFGNPFEGGPLPDWITEEALAEHQQAVGPHTARDVAMWDATTDPKYPRYPGEIRDMGDLRRMIDGYDCGIRYMDDHIGQLLGALDRQGVLDDLAVIISSDHAENMGEFGIYGEHATADQSRPRTDTCRAVRARAPPRLGWSQLRAGRASGRGMRPGVSRAQPVRPRMPAIGAVWSLALHADPSRWVPAVSRRDAVRRRAGPPRAT